MLFCFYGCCCALGGLVPRFFAMSAPPANPRPVYVQTAADKPLRGAEARSQKRASEGRKLYGMHCGKCHGADGKGVAARSLFPEIPDFTNAAWQEGRNDAQLLLSILDGKGAGMPGWKEKLSKEQAQSLTHHVRAFSATRKGGKQTSPASFDDVRRLQEEFERLQGQFWKLSARAAEVSAAVANKSPGAANKSPAVAAAQPEANATAGVRTLFLTKCAKCHEADGTGSTGRKTSAAIPDFTDASWQNKRTDERLLASISGGKGRQMPSWKGKLSNDQARSLVVHVRAFARDHTSAGKAKGSLSGKPQGEAKETDSCPEQEEPEAKTTAPVKADVSESGGDCLAKLVAWLGRFHPAAVSFPLALLAAAALAECLKTFTGRPFFDAPARYCIWLGACLAVVAALLGWCAAGLSLTEDAWILRTHRWLGTATASCAVVVLALSEISRRQGSRLRICFRMTLFATAGAVLTTGFFGGALVFGLGHYDWPE